MRFLLLTSVLFLILCASWCCIALRTDPIVAGERKRAPSSADIEHVLDALERGPEREAAGAAPVSGVSERIVSDDDLIERLRATARAFSDSDSRALERSLESLLFVAPTPRRVLALVRDGELALDSLESVGAMLVIGFGAASEVRRSTLTLAGKPFTREVLEALAVIEAEPAAPIARFAAGLVSEGRPAIGARWLPLIAVLRDQAPLHASNFDPLVHAILASSEEVGAAPEVMAELAGIVSHSTDALAVEAALAVLLATDPDTFLLVAEELHARSKRAPPIAQAVVNAIARHAPVEAGARSLARLANGSEYGAFFSLGERTGALEAVGREYSALVAARENAIGRKMLVSAMGAEEAPVLLGIAATDPDAGVRHQALLTATLRPTDALDVMRTVRAGHALRSDGTNGMSTRSALSVAENLLLNGAPGVRADAVWWLKEVVVDPTERMQDRELAWTKLKAQARAEEIAGLQEPR